MTGLGFHSENPTDTIVHQQHTTQLLLFHEGILATAAQNREAKNGEGTQKGRPSVDLQLIHLFYSFAGRHNQEVEYVNMSSNSVLSFALVVFARLLLL